MPKVSIALCALVLCSCASTSYRVADPPPAHQAEAAPVAPPRILLSTLPGWERSDLSVPDGAAAVFRNDAAHAEIRAYAVRGDRDRPEGMIAAFARDLRSHGVAVETAPSEGGSYASLRWSGEHAGAPARGLIAVRRPSGRSDLLLVMRAHWPASADPSFDDGVDLMCLLATVE